MPLLCEATKIFVREGYEYKMLDEDFTREELFGTLKCTTFPQTAHE